MTTHVPEPEDMMDEQTPAEQRNIDRLFERPAVAEGFLTTAKRDAERLIPCNWPDASHPDRVAGDVLDRVIDALENVRAAARNLVDFEHERTESRS